MLHNLGIHCLSIYILRNNIFIPLFINQSSYPDTQNNHHDETNFEYLKHILRYVDKNTYTLGGFYALRFGPQREKTCLRGFANNTGADQPAHPRSMISAFVIRFLESVICKLATGDIFNYLGSRCS